MDNPPDIVELSRKRLKSLFRGNSLQENVIETIIASFNSCTSLNQQNGLAARVAPVLRDELLQEVLRRMKFYDQFGKLAKVIPFLLSPMTKTLNLKALDLQTSYDYVDLPYIDEVLNRAAQLAPNIERISFINRGVLTDDDSAANIVFLSKLINDFRHLQILRVQNYSANFHELVVLCGHLPSLRVLKLLSVRNVLAPSSGEEISKSLGNLRLLCVYDMEISRPAIDKIRQHVPNLDIIYDLKQTGLSFDDFLQPEGDPNLSQRKIFTLDRSWFDHPDAEIHERHPNIVHLEVQGHDVLGFSLANLFMPNFPKISSLSIETENFDIAAFLLQLAERFLQRYGQNLRSFSLVLEDWIEDTYNIERLFSLCPNIESVKLDGLESVNSPLKYDDNPYLQELSWINFELRPNVFLFPQLKKLELKRVYTYEWNNDSFCEHLSSIATKIADKEILLELEMLRIDIYLALSAIGFTSFTQIIKNASAFLPKLSDLQLSFEDQEYVALARRMKRSKRFKATFFNQSACDADVPDVFVDEQLIDTLSLYLNRN